MVTLTVSVQNVILDTKIWTSSSDSCSVAETGLVWVGAGQRIPVILFSANAVQQLEHPIDQPFASKCL